MQEAQVPCRIDDLRLDVEVTLTTPFVSTKAPRMSNRPLIPLR
jgi:hypothetical protein